MTKNEYIQMLTDMEEITDMDHAASDGFHAARLAGRLDMLEFALKFARFLKDDEGEEKK